MSTARSRLRRSRKRIYIPAIRRFAGSEGWQREQGRFVPQMGNWLRGQRWLDPLPLAEQAEAAQNQSKLQALRVREEQEQRLKEQKDAERARLRPLFDAFAAKFPPIANDAMPFGIWQYLHSQNRVPPENSLGIIEFLNEFKRRRQTEGATKRDTQALFEESLRQKQLTNWATQCAKNSGHYHFLTN